MAEQSYASLFPWLVVLKLQNDWAFSHPAGTCLGGGDGSDGGGGGANGFIRVTTTPPTPGMCRIGSVTILTGAVTTPAIVLVTPPICHMKKNKIIQQVF